MAWISLLAIESHTGPRDPVQVKPPINAAKFAIRCPWDADSRVDPGRHLSVRTYKLTVGTQTASAPISRGNFDSTGAPELAPDDVPFPGTGGFPVDLVGWESNNELEFRLLHTHDNGAQPMAAGLQVKWFNASGVELTADGNVEPNPSE